MLNIKNIVLLYDLINELINLNILYNFEHASFKDKATKCEQFITNWNNILIVSILINYYNMHYE